MSLSYRLRPGAGFVLLLSVLLLAAAFFAWGLKTPALERVWQMQLELMLGSRDALSARDFALLEGTLTRYPELADNMLEETKGGLISANAEGLVDTGHAVLVRKSSSAPGVLTVTAASDKKLALRVRASGHKQSGECAQGAPFVWPLPDGPFPQLIEVFDASGHKKPRPMRVELLAAP